MKTIVKLLSIVLAVAILLSACAQAATPVQPTATTTVPEAPRQIQLTEADQGKNITINPGDSLIIVLDSNPSTGYDWKVKPVENPVLALESEPVFKANSDKLGTPGRTSLTLKTVASGSQVITLLYQRSFEKDAQPAKTFTINVTVSGAASGSSPKPTAAISNPAAKYCIEQGFKSEIRTAADGSQYGVCTFPNGSACDEWKYFRDECKAGK